MGVSMKMINESGVNNLRESIKATPRKSIAMHPLEETKGNNCIFEEFFIIGVERDSITQ